MRVVKFGGSSVATPETIRQVVRVVAGIRKQGPVVVVVSAFGGVTDTLLAASASAEARGDWRVLWRQIRERHLAAATLLAAGEPGLTEDLDRLIDELGHLLHGVELLREVSPRVADGIAAYGERLSSMVVAAALRDAGVGAEAVDTRRLIITDDSYGRAQVDVEVSYPNLRRRLLGDGGGQGTDGVAVLTGFTGSTPEGQTTTLGRGGSDYTAALVGAALGADAIELWTDVSGVMTADPRQVPDAFVQPHLSYAELMELSHFGAKVVYAPSVHPARSARIPLLIKNTFEPEAPGTRIAETAPAAQQPIRGITSIRSVALVRLEGDGMVGVPGIAERLFGALARRQVSVILISQSSSEHSICFVVDAAEAAAVRRATQAEFALERQHGIVDDVVVEEKHTVVAVVGAQMASRPGIAGQVFSVLGAHGVNVRAIAQGSSELNISLVVEGADEVAAVRAIHDAFFCEHRRLDVALAGVGRVGAELLRQLAATRADLRRRDGLDLRLVGVASSRRLLLAAPGESLDPAAAAEALASETPQEPDTVTDGLCERLESSLASHRVFVDCTASDRLTGAYRRLLGAGVSVVAANKKPFSGPLDAFRALLAASRGKEASLRFEATAGAGLPVLRTLADLRRTGDSLVSLDGVLSGTLNAVLDRLAEDRPLSAAVREAYDAGLTEPHPYDDLSGVDVQRKLCILARLAGRELELPQIEVEPLVPDVFEGLDLETFWRRLPELDHALEARRREAEESGARLRYLARLDDKGARVGLVATPLDHPAASLAGPDNLVALRTARYDHTPLVVRGPGAGPAVTAAGVFADILQAAGAGGMTFFEPPDPASADSA